MKNTRQDAWTENEDKLLADMVLLFIKEGKTQLEAFKEVAYKLKRTPAACGFRWNASLRQTYAAHIEKAKQERNNEQPEQLQQEEEAGENLNIDAAIYLLEKVKRNYNAAEEGAADSRIKELEEENNILRLKVQRYKDVCLEMEKLCKWAIKE